MDSIPDNASHPPGAVPDRDPEDIDAMRRAAQGDVSAFEEIVLHHQDALVNFFRRLGVYSEAEDLVQDTFMRVYRRCGDYEARARFTTYLYRVARSVWVDWSRRSGRQRDRIKAAAEAAALGLEGHSGLSERARDAADAVATLPEKLRVVVVLSVFQGLKYQEISEVLDIPVGTVKSRMSLAMRRLKEVLHA